MSKQQDETPGEEPIGIVISRGKTPNLTPRFTAYVWGTADDVENETLKPAAA